MGLRKGQPHLIISANPSKKPYQARGEIIISDYLGQQWEAVMKITYDPEVDVIRIVFSNAPIEESDEEKPGVILDYDKDGNVVGMEILDASRRIENPRAVEYAVAG